MHLTRGKFSHPSGPNYKPCQILYMSYDEHSLLIPTYKYCKSVYFSTKLSLRQLGQSTTVLKLNSNFQSPTSSEASKKIPAEQRGFKVQVNKRK